MTDLGERLRNRIHDSHMDAEHLMDEATAEIVRMATEIARLASLADDMGQTNIASQIEIEQLRTDYSLLSDDYRELRLDNERLQLENDRLWRAIRDGKVVPMS